jgi:hypothetical protein
LAHLLALLHRHRIFFRAVHLGNVLVQPDGAMALIDLSETQFRRLPLSRRLRCVNLRQMMSYPEDRRAIEQFGLERFIQLYLAAAGLNPSHADGMITALRS